MTAALPMVSVVIPVDRSLDSLGRVLNALAAQSLAQGEFEVIVVDNGGNPRIKKLLEEYPQCLLAVESQVGSYAARNTGAQCARGGILAFTDADCIPDPEWLATGVEILARRAEVDLVGGRIELQYREGRPRTFAERYEEVMAFPQQRYVSELHFAVTANLMVRRRVFDALEGFDAELQSGGDRDFGERATAAGFCLIYEPQVLVVHPARASIAALTAKARRVAGGEMALWLGGNANLNARRWLNLLVPPLLWSLRLLVDRSFSYGIKSRMAVIFVQNLLYLAVLPIYLRALLKHWRGPVRTQRTSAKGSR